MSAIQSLAVWQKKNTDKEKRGKIATKFRMQDFQKKVEISEAGWLDCCVFRTEKK